MNTTTKTNCTPIVPASLEPMMCAHPLGFIWNSYNQRAACPDCGARS